MTKTITIEIEVDVEFTFTKGYPANIFGPPENCYPGEPDEFEIESASVYAPNPKFGKPNENKFIAINLSSALTDAQKADIEKIILSEEDQ